MTIKHYEDVFLSYQRHVPVPVSRTFLSCALFLSRLPFFEYETVCLPNIEEFSHFTAHIDIDKTKLLWKIYIDFIRLFCGKENPVMPSIRYSTEKNVDVFFVERLALVTSRPSSEIATLLDEVAFFFIVNALLRRKVPEPDYVNILTSFLKKKRVSPDKVDLVSYDILCRRHAPAINPPFVPENHLSRMEIDTIRRKDIQNSIESYLKNIPEEF